MRRLIILAACLFLCGGFVSAKTVTLKFDSLPSAQGWSLLNSCPFGESALFSVANGVLHQNTIGCGTTAAYYGLGGVVDSTPYTLTVRARVTADEVLLNGSLGHLGLSFGAQGNGKAYYIGLGPGIIEALVAPGITITTLSTSIDTTQYHTYVLSVTPATGGFTLAADGTEIGSGIGGDLAGSNLIFLGDASSDGNAAGDYTAFAYQSGCQVNPNDMRYFSDGPFSRDHKHTTMKAAFTPSGVSLPDLAAACGFNGFDWVQQITMWPGPSGLFAMSAPTIPIILPPGNINDPPFGGYTYSESQQPPFFEAYPFYYNPVSITFGCAIQQNDGTCIEYIMNGLGRLNFFDSPLNGCLVDSPPLDCQGNFTTPRFATFRTQLVGICNSVPSAACRSAGKPSTPLFHWTWNDDFNGTTGGVFGVRTASVSLPDPGSGTGGVTITDINGVAQTSPSVSCSATPNTLWPPNGKSILVTVSGTVAPGTQVVPAGSTTYAVSDEYGQVQLSGSINVGADGSYSFGVSLIAERNGNDLDGRTYSIFVGAVDTIGNVGSCTALATVLHDQAH